MTDQDEDLSADVILANPSHPIWKICLALVAILASAWGIQNGNI